MSWVFLPYVPATRFGFGLVLPDGAWGGWALPAHLPSRHASPKLPQCAELRQQPCP